MRSLLLMVGFVVGCSEGSKGPPGPEGLPGERGDDGVPGSQGERGPLGPQGDRGSIGDPGRRGEGGAQGERGEQGVAGSSGSIGPQGSVGPSGADGRSCFGESVPDGMQITCGEETFVLRHGEDGESGSPGAMGLTGQKGDRGDDGEMGPQGERGSVGSQGAPGRDGVSCTAEDVLEGFQITCGDLSVLIRHGEQGLPGERGEQGSAGVQGEIGPMGLQGPPGERGVQGPEGARGPAGSPGEPGEEGLPGASLHLLDGDGQDLGIWMGQNVTYLPTLDIMVTFSTSSSEAVVRGYNEHIWFDGANCGGSAYIETAGEWQALQSLFAGNPNLFGYYRIVPGAQPADVFVTSKPCGCGDEDIHCENRVPFSRHVYPAEQIVLPFVEPLAWPLKVGVVQ